MKKYKVKLKSKQNISGSVISKGGKSDYQIPAHQLNCDVKIASCFNQITSKLLNLAKICPEFKEFSFKLEGEEGGQVSTEIITTGPDEDSIIEAINIYEKIYLKIKDTNVKIPIEAFWNGYGNHIVKIGDMFSTDEGEDGEDINSGANLEIPQIRLGMDAHRVCDVNTVGSIRFNNIKGEEQCFEGCLKIDNKYEWKKFKLQ